ncbi:MAG TPA: TonB-dependent receptor [Candidatus Solibacter sp.]
MKSLAAALFLALPLIAQSDLGELRLTVRDPSGAPLAARADLVSSATGTRIAIDLASDGRYAFHALPFGLYRLRVTHANFAPATELIALRSAVPLAHEVTLAVAAVDTSVLVTESATLVDPTATSATYHVSSEDLKQRAESLPGRGLTDLVIMQPGWTIEANGILHPRESEYDTQYVVNGFPIYDNRSPAFAPAADADDVESLKIYAGGIPAEFGQKLGGVIEVNTVRNTNPGFHGALVLQHGSFATNSAFASAQWVAGRTTASVNGEGFLTDHYLDPPVVANFANHGSNSSVAATLEHDFDDSNRLRLSASRRETGFLVPNDFLQQAAGQRQDRTAGATEGQAYAQHIFSPTLIGTFGVMARDLTARLWSNPLSTPIAAGQDRGFREAYIKASLAGHHGRHEWKTGIDARFADLREEFDYQITAYRLNPGNVRIFSRSTPATYYFNGTSPDREQAAYAQDTFRLGPVTLSAGLRFDHYALLIHDSAASPRLAASWNVRPLGLVLHASFDRIFGTPPFENLLVSSAPASRLGIGFYLPLKAAHGNYYEAGFTRAIGGQLRLDATYFRRDVGDFKDDDPLLNTAVSFPIAFQHAEIRGIELKLALPRWHGLSGFASYANTIGIGQYPISGGLFLDSDAPALLRSTDRFPISQDQRNTARAMLRYQFHPRLWTAWSANYNSGLPTEDISNLPPMNFLNAQYGPEVVAKVNFDRARVLPSFTLNASLGADLWHHEKRSLTFQLDVTNVTDRLNLINFTSFLSGTALAPPRGASARLRWDW